MIGVAWNCQGLGNSSTVKELRHIIIQKKPTFIFLMETKKEKQEMLNMVSSLGFDNSWIVECNTGFGGRRGGLCLAWLESMEISITSWSDHHIEGLVKKSENKPD